MLCFICPKCGQFTRSLHGLKKICQYCNTQMLETTYEYPLSASVEEIDKLIKKIFEEYVKDNPLYDPQEEKISIEKEKQDSAEHARQCAIKRTAQKNIPKCPTCGSTNVEKIGTLERGISVTAWGLFSSKVGKTMKCKNCGYKW